MLTNKALNKWPLFWLLSTPISLAVIAQLFRVDLSNGEGVSYMIGYAVRWAVPFVFLVIAISSINTLFPSAFSKWLLRNREYFGLCFAVAMFWQGVFIFTLSTVYREYYISDIYYFRDELEGTIGYLFLAAMAITSFQIGRKRVSASQWKTIHTCGVYFLWAYPFSVYWWNLFYYPSLEPYADPRPLDYLLYVFGFLAVAVRIAAWGKKRVSAAKPSGSASPGLSAVGSLFILFGLVAAATGSAWQGTVTDFMTGSGHVAEMPLWLPFWPLEPFLPLFVIGIGTLLLTHREHRA